MTRLVSSAEFAGICTTQRWVTRRNKSRPVHRFSVCPNTGVVHSATRRRTFSFLWTTELAATVAALVSHFETIYRKHMRDLPIVNRNLRVEAINFQEYDGDQLGVLITPWFMNLVLLPNDAHAPDCAQGSKSSIDFPSGAIEFTGCLDDTLGCFRTAVLFRTVTDLPSQYMARDVARQVMLDLFVKPRDQGTQAFSRRALFTGRGVS